ncbi:MAG: hypothetical protein KC466_17940, partial [Myxococcales bacterium]|nr:hypothetical protein [Myxococcales bacterium]
VGFFIRYWDTPYGYIPAFWILALWSAVGLAVALEGLTKRIPRLQPGWVGAAFALVVCFHGATSWAHADKSAYRATESLARETFLTLPEGALTFAVVQWFQAVYLQEIEGRRLDLPILMTGELKAPQWFRSVTAERFPGLQFPDEPLTSENFSRYMPALIRENIGERRVFLEVDQDTFMPLEKNLVPRGFLFEIVPDAEIARRGR